MGVKSKTIHSLSQALGTGVVFLELQLKEYTAAFLTFRDSIFGSDFYGTTCLHGLHVTNGYFLNSGQCRSVAYTGKYLIYQ